MPNSASKPTVRSLAQALGLSRTTVSDALRGSSRVDPVTSRRVVLAAQAAGYTKNPLISRMMSEIKRANGQGFRGNLAAIEFSESDRLSRGIIQEELLAGAREAAGQLGFSLEYFLVGGSGHSPHRVERILKCRDVSGLLILPARRSPDLYGFDWSSYSAVYMGRILGGPALPTVTTDAFEAVLLALSKLAGLGYRRPGLYVEEGRDALDHYRSSAALYSFQTLYRGVEFVPILRVAERRRDEFCAWFTQHRPDVILHEQPEVISWMEACGVRIPETHGFVSLNKLYCQRPCAAIDLQLRDVGMRAVEMLAGRLRGNEWAISDRPWATTIPVRWVEGSTVRVLSSKPGTTESLAFAGPVCLA